MTKKKLKNQFTRKIYLHKLFDSFKLFARNRELGIMDNDIIQLNSSFTSLEDKISIRRTKNAIDKLEQMGWINKISSKPKQHEYNLPK